MSPILHVRITDQDGREMADVDASSTADALAYFLDNRRIWRGVTENDLRRSILICGGKTGLADDEQIEFRADGVLYRAEVH